MEDLPDADRFLRAIHDCDYDRDSGAHGDAVETRLPLFHRVPRALGRDHQNEFLGSRDFLHHLFHQPLWFGAVHGYPSAPPEKAAKRWSEQFRLAHEADICAEMEDHTEEQYKIPIGGMRCADHDELWQVRQAALHVPANDAQNQFAKLVEKAAEEWGVEYRCSQVDILFSFPLHPDEHNHRRERG